MPKHGWKWRTEQVRKLDDDGRLDLDCLYKASLKLLKWIYKNLPNHRIEALCAIGFLEGSATRKFLWKELEKHKGDDMGDRVIVALGRSCIWWPGEAERYVAIYAEGAAHLRTRGSAVFGMSHAMSAARMHASDKGRNPMAPETLALIRDACHRAIYDEANPYARAGACWLGPQLGLDEEIAHLANDQTPIEPRDSMTVASYYSPPDEN